MNVIWLRLVYVVVIIVLGAALHTVNTNDISQFHRRINVQDNNIQYKQQDINDQYESQKETIQNSSIITNTDIINGNVSSTEDENDENNEYNDNKLIEELIIQREILWANREIKKYNDIYGKLPYRSEVNIIRDNNVESFNLNDQNKIKLNLRNNNKV